MGKAADPKGQRNTGSAKCEATKYTHTHARANPHTQVYIFTAGVFRWHSHPGIWAELDNTQLITHGTHIKSHICQINDLHNVQIGRGKLDLTEKCFNLTAIFARHRQASIRNKKKQHVDTETFITDTPAVTRQSTSLRKVKEIYKNILNCINHKPRFRLIWYTCISFFIEGKKSIGTFGSHYVCFSDGWGQVHWFTLTPHSKKFLASIYCSIDPVGENDAHENVHIITLQIMMQQSHKHRVMLHRWLLCLLWPVSRFLDGGHRI